MNHFRLLFKPTQFFLCLATLSGTAGNSLAAVGSNHPLRVPAGFEALLQGQTEHVEVVLFGRKLGMFSARVTLDTLQFDDPSAVADAVLGNAPERDNIRAEIVQALTPPLARNGNLACLNKNSGSGCGYVQTDRAAIIYDENRAAVGLFLKPNWVDKLDVARADTLYQSISSEAQNAFVHRQSANFSIGKDYRSLSVQGGGALGVGHSAHIGTDWSLFNVQTHTRSNTRARFNNLYFRHDLGKTHYVQAGRMDQRNLFSPLGGNFGFSMLPLPRFDGVRVGSTQAYRNASYAGEATPVTVLLSRAARVDLFHGSELLGTQYLSEGVQKLNTASLPAGSYPLTLHIYENGVLARTENLPFSKTGAGFGDTGLQWFAQAGRALSPDAVDPSTRQDQGKRGVAQTGVRFGVTPDFFLTSGLSSVSGSLYNDSRVEWQRKFGAGVFSTAVSHLAGSDGSRGNSQRISFSHGAHWSLYRYQMRGTACHRAWVSNPADVGCYDSLSASVSFPVKEWFVQAGHIYGKSHGRPLRDRYQTEPYAATRSWLPVERGSSPETVSRAFQLGASRSFQWGQMSFNTRLGAYRNLRSGLSHADSGIYASVTISSSKYGSGHTSGGIDVRAPRNGSTQVGYSAAYSRSWQDGNYRDFNASLTGYRNQSYTASLGGRVEGRYGNLGGTVSNVYQRQDRHNYPSLTGSYSSSLAIGRSGVYWGSDNGNTVPSAAFAVQVGKNDEKTADPVAEVSGGFARPSRLGYGSSTLVPIEGYQRSLTEVRDISSNHASASSNVSSGGGSSEYFLPPGKLVLREVAAETSYTYVGRALDHHGEPLDNAVVLNTPLPNLDEQGGFVLNMRVRPTELYLQHTGRVFSCPMVVSSQRDVIHVVGQTRCTLINASNLPEQLRLSARVKRLLNETAKAKTKTTAPDRIALKR